MKGIGGLLVALLTIAAWAFQLWLFTYIVCSLTHWAFVPVCITIGVAQGVGLSIFAGAKR